MASDRQNIHLSAMIAEISRSCIRNGVRGDEITGRNRCSAVPVPALFSGRGESVGSVPAFHQHIVENSQRIGDMRITAP